MFPGSDMKTACATAGVSKCHEVFFVPNQVTHPYKHKVFCLLRSCCDTIAHWMQTWRASQCIASFMCFPWYLWICQPLKFCLQTFGPAHNEPSQLRISVH